MEPGRTAPEVAPERYARSESATEAAGRDKGLPKGARGGQGCLGESGMHKTGVEL